MNSPSWRTELESKATKVSDDAMPTVIDRFIVEATQAFRDYIKATESKVAELPPRAALLCLNKLRDGFLEQQRETFRKGYLDGTDADRVVADIGMMSLSFYLDFLDELIEITEAQVAA
jgi:hypothetical protein